MVPTRADPDPGPITKAVCQQTRATTRDLMRDGATGRTEAARIGPAIGIGAVRRVEVRGAPLCTVVSAIMEGIIRGTVPIPVNSVWVARKSAQGMVRELASGEGPAGPVGVAVVTGARDAGRQTPASSTKVVEAAITGVLQGGADESSETGAALRGALTEAAELPQILITRVLVGLAGGSEYGPVQEDS